MAEDTTWRDNGVRHGQQRPLTSVRDGILTETATAVGWQVVHDIVDSIRVETVDDVEQTDLE